eukprot:TRINITY_DN4965_c0_g1_i3.p1 TRINITY_DN4965_c0_g1~~TRINITY_DN4965_c0_g1_i3.p1  ORF type:complete len:172 (-),score=29.64 TRINITY_DN4965_c0_g1_i3:48-563(-)
MLLSSFWPCYQRCKAGYGIGMKPPASSDKPETPMAKIIKHFKLIPTEVSTTLNLFSLEKNEIERVLSLLREHRGDIGFLSLAGIKDIVLGSTGAPMPLLHVHWGHRPEGPPELSGIYYEEPQEGYQHMFCIPEGDPLLPLIEELNFKPTATASILSSSMKSDWKFVLTSEI